MICKECGMGYNYKENGMNCPNCAAINKRDDGKPHCPNCEAENKHLEYVADITEAASVDGVSSNGVIMGDVYESYDPKFHHISCGNCGTYWESEKEFAEAVRGKYVTEGNGKEEIEIV